MLRVRLRNGLFCTAIGCRPNGSGPIAATLGVGQAWPPDLGLDTACFATLPLLGTLNIG